MRCGSDQVCTAPHHTARFRTATHRTGYNSNSRIRTAPYENKKNNYSPNRTAPCDSQILKSAPHCTPGFSERKICTAVWCYNVQICTILPYTWHIIVLVPSRDCPRCSRSHLLFERLASPSTASVPQHVYLESVSQHLHDGDGSGLSRLQHVIEVPEHRGPHRHCRNHSRQ